MVKTLRVRKKCIEFVVWHPREAKWGSVRHERGADVDEKSNLSSNSQDVGNRTLHCFILCVLKPWCMARQHKLYHNRIRRTCIHLVLSDMWLGVAPKMDSKRTPTQIMITDLGSIVNINWGDPYYCFMSIGIHIWYWISYLYELQNVWGKWLQPWFGIVDHLVLIACFMSHEKRVSWLDTIIDQIPRVEKYKLEAIHIFFIMFFHNNQHVTNFLSEYYLWLILVL